jgi:hypothetical protein
LYQFERKYIWTFAEIGAGQETVRDWWFIWYNSKAMSAYDKDFSDAIWYRETDAT